MEKSKFSTKQLVLAGILLAICIVSQFFKNLSIFITGPIINACLIICLFYCGPLFSVILSIITPVTSFFITGSPIISAIPLILPCIMIGNIVYVICTYYLSKSTNKNNKLLIVWMGIASIAKAIVMGVLISLWLVPSFLPEKMMPMKPTIQTTFSLFQLITALIGSVFAYIIIQVLGAAKVESN